jgi:hypothetical protein
LFKIFFRLFKKLSENYYKKDNPYIKPKNNSSLEIKKKFYLKVPFAEKEAAKKYGAKWHQGRKQWYLQGNLIANGDFAKWLDFDEEYNVFAMHFYLAQSSRSCWNCKKNTPVWAILYDNYECIYSIKEVKVGSKEILVPEWGKVYEPFFTSLSDLDQETIKDFLSISHPVVEECMAIAQRENAQQYCAYCNKKQGNFYLFGEVDFPFSFINPRVLDNIKLYKINFSFKSVSMPTGEPSENSRSYIRKATVETINIKV